MSNQPRKTSNIVKRVDDVEETIPDFYGPQGEEPVGVFKKGDMWFVEDGVRSVGKSKTSRRARPLRERKHIKKTHKLQKKGK